MKEEVKEIFKNVQEFFTYLIKIFAAVVCCAFGGVIAFFIVGTALLLIVTLIVGTFLLCAKLWVIWLGGV